MKFRHPLIEGTLVRRYKRFLADVELAGGEMLTAHTANTGSMLGCSDPGSRVWLSDSGNLKRKYRHTLEIVESPSGALVGVNTGLANTLVEEAVAGGAVPELQGYTQLRREVRYGEEGSRIDLLLQSTNDRRCFVEVKNVTTCDSDGCGFFPDAVSARGTKHLRELMSVVAGGERAVLFFCVQRNDPQMVRPADEIDPTYGQTLREAADAGVELLAYRAEIFPSGIALKQPLPVICPDWSG